MLKGYFYIRALFRVNQGQGSVTGYGEEMDQSSGKGFGQMG
jgi:hypothetical protein